ncbi:MAG: hypothetical protein ACLP81_00780 [Acidimicrobiales bacterium]
MLAYEELGALARSYLDRQSWFQLTIPGARAGEIELVGSEVLREASPPLCRLLLACRGRHFSVFAGWREAAEATRTLHGPEGAIFGTALEDGRSVLVYDALADDALALELLRRATGGRETATRVRQVATAVSHASLVYDGRLLMKCYRVLEDTTRPEIDVLMGLDAVGFNAILAPVSVWAADGFDLALVREFLPSALEGRLLALTSLRDLLARASGHDRSDGAGPSAFEPGLEFDAAAVAASAGGDLASEMSRLGSTAARLHLALVDAFGASEVSAAALADQIASLTAAGAVRRRPVERARAASGLVGRLRGLGPGPAGAAIRVHGDFHLRRVMRTESGWVVVGFGDDPLFADPLPRASLAPRTGTPIEDLADMWFSIGRTAWEALAQRPVDEVVAADRLARAWVERNRRAFLDGYVATRDVGRLLPAEAAIVEELLGVLTAAREHLHGSGFSDG